MRIVLVLGTLMAIVLAFLFVQNQWQEQKSGMHGQTTSQTVSSIFTQTQTLTDVSYSSDVNEKLDVYIPNNAENAPVIVMVHGVGSDKASDNVVTNKVNYWGPQGYIFVSINYPTIPDATADEQAQSVAAALAYVQTEASTWNGNGNNMTVMGHSAGAYLVALVSAKRTSYPNLRPWQGSILLDSPSLDLVTLMKKDHLDIYDTVFGTNQTYWNENSPYYNLTAKTESLFVVCSSVRTASNCEQATAYVNKAKTLGTNATIYPVALQHRDININVGLANTQYTADIDAFIKSL